MSGFSAYFLAAPTRTVRARIFANADSTRRRIERDLHDGAQQQLIALALELRAAQATVPAELGELRAELSSVIHGLTSLLDEVREIAHGIHPSILAEGGLGSALKTLAHRSPIPVQLDVQADAQLPEPVELAAYYIVSEALANTAKYAQASVVSVAVEARDRVLRVAIRDDGIGGADPARGSGLLGLKDRAEAIGGTISLQSPRGAGTSLHVELPLDDSNCQEADLRRGDQFEDIQDSCPEEIVSAEALAVEPTRNSSRRGGRGALEPKRRL